MPQFQRYQLRTTDPSAARAFYGSILGDRVAEIVPLPPEAIARGAPPHWLGHLGVDEVEPTARAFVERGAMRLGPTRATAEGELAIVRDPGGAVFALTKARSTPARDDVVFHLLHTHDLARVTASYGALFGWEIDEGHDLGPLGVFREFAWHRSGPRVGAMTDVSARPGVHAHWLFQFRVASLNVALPLVRAAGGVVAGPTELPGGDRLAVCDDPQGAAFALREQRAP